MLQVFIALLVLLLTVLQALNILVTILKTKGNKKIELAKYLASSALLGKIRFT